MAFKYCSAFGSILEASGCGLSAKATPQSTLATAKPTVAIRFLMIKFSVICEEKQPPPHPDNADASSCQLFQAVANSPRARDPCFRSFAEPWLSWAFPAF